jgi:peptide/nickel transport system permease protein
MISTLQEDFIALAKSKGLSTWYILFHHALRPSSFTLVTVLGLQLGNLITGSIIIETLFSVPGVGQLLINSVDNRDEIMVQGVITFVALVYVVVNLIVDLLYAVLDPRVGSKAKGGEFR